MPNDRAENKGITTKEISDLSQVREFLYDYQYFPSSVLHCLEQIYGDGDGKRKRELTELYEKLDVNINNFIKEVNNLEKLLKEDGANKVELTDENDKKKFYSSKEYSYQSEEIEGSKNNLLTYGKEIKDCLSKIKEHPYNRSLEEKKKSKTISEQIYAAPKKMYLGLLSELHTLYVGFRAIFFLIPLDKETQKKELDRTLKENNKELFTFFGTESKQDEFTKKSEKSATSTLKPK